MPGIIWLASYPKSGNTWLRAFLANLFSNPDHPVPINELPDYIYGDNLLAHYEQFSGIPADRLDEEKLRELRPRVHEWIARSRREDVFVKTHSAMLIADGVPLITPRATAGAIYVVRNPLDVAVSFSHHYQVTIDRAVESLCEKEYYLPASSGQIAQYLSSWSRHVKSWLEAPGLTLHVMRYEDMLRDPVKAFGALVRFLSLPKDPPRLKKAIKFSSFRELKTQEQRDRFIESRPDGRVRFFREGKSGAWREALTESHIDRLVECHGEVMRDFGYLKSNGKIAV